MNRLLDAFRKNSNNNRLSKKNSMGSKMAASTRSGPDPSTLTHYILKTPLNPVAKGSPAVGEKTEVAEKGLRAFVVATGCYWGSEKSFWRMNGVYSTSVGNIGGSVENPSYEMVCTGTTGHAESVLVVWDPSKIGFADLIRQFLQSHDPTQGNRQGNDRGTQYRSGIYVNDPDELKVAQAAIKEYEKALGRKITTELKYPAPPFYFAEDYMQQYLAKPGSRPYCSAQPQGVDLTDYSVWGPSDVPEELKAKLPESYWKANAPSPHCVLREPNDQRQPWSSM